MQGYGPDERRSFPQQHIPLRFRQGEPDERWAEPSLVKN